MNDEDEVCTSRDNELVYENIECSKLVYENTVLCVVCVCTYIYLFMCTYVSMAVHKLMHVSIGLYIMAANAFSRVHSILGVESRVGCGELPPNTPLPPPKK